MHCSASPHHAEQIQNCCAMRRNAIPGGPSTGASSAPRIVFRDTGCTKKSHTTTGTPSSACSTKEAARHACACEWYSSSQAFFQCSAGLQKASTHQKQQQAWGATQRTWRRNAALQPRGGPMTPPKMYPAAIPMVVNCTAQLLLRRNCISSRTVAHTRATLCSMAPEGSLNYVQGLTCRRH